MPTTIPNNFALFNADPTKQLVIVFKIDGLDDILSSAPVGDVFAYGDPVLYGDPDLFYGGIKPWIGPNGGIARQLLILDKSSLSLTQTVEPEQGRSSIAQMSASFIDADQYMTKLCSPGKLIPDILGAGIKVYLGYAQISFPQDYLLVFRGVVQAVNTNPGVVTLQIGDPNLKRRQSLFFFAQTVLTSDISDVASTIPVVNTTQFIQPIIGPDNINYDTNVQPYIVIDNEIISYGHSALGSGHFLGCLRGRRGTTGVAHTAGTTVNAAVEIGYYVGDQAPPTYAGTGINPLELALKLMLSGWNGPYLTNVPVSSIVYTGLPFPLTTIADSITLMEGTDAVQDLGLSPGDYITITADTVTANNGLWIVQSFLNYGDFPNGIILVNGPMTLSTSGTAKMALRSQYDTFPVTCGLKMYPWEVDVQQHQNLIDQIINAQSENLSFYLDTQQSSGKQFIEQEVYLPITAYSITRNGQCSVNITLPPIAGQTLVTLDSSNVLDPQNITVQRSLSNRNFFNEVDWNYDPDDAGNFTFEYDVIDSNSLSIIGISSILPITSLGLRQLISGQTVVQARSSRFLNRFKNAAVLINLKTNFAVANSVNPGDIVILSDTGQLQIPNFTTGSLDLGRQLYEIRNRTLDIKTGTGSLQLLANQNFSISDRFATWAPSSLATAAGNTTTSCNLQLLVFGSSVGFAEWKKWINYIGATLIFHDKNWTYSGTSVLQTVSGVNSITFSPALAFTPNATTLVDLAPYSTSIDPLVEQLEKQVHCFWDRSAPVTAAVDATSFHVGAGDVQYFIVGYPIVVHTPTWSNQTSTSPTTVVDAVIQSVVGTLITITNPNSAAYTPAINDICEVLSFPDAQVGYRFI